MDKLSEILGLVNGWLRFAEAKNGVLIAASGAGLWALLHLITTADVSLVATVYLVQLSGFFGLALVAGLVSFLPVMNYVLLIPLNQSGTNKNLLFFGYLAALRPETLLQELRESTEASEGDAWPLHEMYAEQIIANSRIALAKYQLFSVGAWCVIFGFLTPILGACLWLIVRPRKLIDGI